MKKCTKCQIEKPYSEFYRHKTSRDGLQGHCKTCFSARTEARRKERLVENPEAERAKVRERMRRHRELHPDPPGQGWKDWYAKDPEKAFASKRESAKRWAQENAEKRKEQVRRWEKANPHFRRVMRQKRRMHKEARDGALTFAEWEKIKEIYGTKCLACGSEENLSIDHVVPLHVGGTNTFDNVQPLCQPCNRAKWTKIIDYRPHPPHEASQPCQLTSFGHHALPLEQPE